MSVREVAPVSGLVLGDAFGGQLYYADAGGVFARGAVPVAPVTPQSPVVPTAAATDWKCSHLVRKDICVLCVYRVAQEHS